MITESSTHDESGRSGLTAQDREAIRDVQHELGYILDEVAYDRFVEIYADDVEFINPNGLNARGVHDLISQSAAISRPAVSHQVTNLIIDDAGDNRARVRTRALTVRADRSLAFTEATDRMERRAEGWRITERQIRLISGAGVSQYT